MRAGLIPNACTVHAPHEDEARRAGGGLRLAAVQLAGAAGGQDTGIAAGSVTDEEGPEAGASTAARHAGRPTHGRIFHHGHRDHCHRRRCAAAAAAALPPLLLPPLPLPLMTK